ncbi:hypothetical protein NDU88_007390 [Pleurodeles waltl]|uniref:Uncharacterized protein n=1 Tax=Pleurodeles waltl TaxID=8319 RepID=A0AAV7LT67_PLEWA|nr:hypothetical protein NDU88_007390 [Pleurodeles waltl]
MRRFVDPSCVSLWLSRFLRACGSLAELPDWSVVAGATAFDAAWGRCVGRVSRCLETAWVAASIAWMPLPGPRLEFPWRGLLCGGFRPFLFTPVWLEARLSCPVRGFGAFFLCGVPSIAGILEVGILSLHERVPEVWGGQCDLGLH